MSLSAAAPALLATLGESAITPVYGNPSQYIPLFAGHIELLQQFLEQVTQRAQPCDTSTWNTLLELQLREEKAAQGEVKARAHEKVMKTLTQPEAQYDKEEALVLVQSYEHQEGQLFLYKEMGMYSLLLQHYLAMKDFPAIVSLCQEMQSGADNLWIELLMVARAGGDGGPAAAAADPELHRAEPGAAHPVRAANPEPERAHHRQHGAAVHHALAAEGTRDHPDSAARCEA